MEKTSLEASVCHKYLFLVPSAVGDVMVREEEDQFRRGRVLIVSLCDPRGNRGSVLSDAAIG